jgi:type II secretory pathway pseudopilin PulG
VVRKGLQQVMKGTATMRRAPQAGEEGYILVAVIFMLAILIISMGVAVPKVRESIQRDREVETMHRGKQYTRAIQLYYRKFNAYPPNIDALVKTNEIRFLRKRYTDPMTGKDDWKPIAFGQNKVPLAFGFFGQPLGGTPLAGTGPGGVVGATNPTSNNFFTTGSPSGGDGTGAASGAAGATGTTGTTGTSGTPSSSGSLSSTQTFGGGGIIGFSPGVEKQSILTYKTKNHYNEWEFTYSPLADQATAQGGNAGTIGTPTGGVNGTPSPGGLSPGPSSGSPSPISPTPSPQQ